MDRLTTDKAVSEMNMIELAHNSCYVKDGKARYRDFTNDLDARELAKDLLKRYTDEDISEYSPYKFDEYMIDLLQEGFETAEGFIAIFYRDIWSMAEMRERLKKYEDAVSVKEHSCCDRWIPVEEAMPPVETEVQITALRKYRGEDEIYIVTNAMYEDGTVREDDSSWYWQDLDGEWDEEADCRIIPEGWWECKHYNPDDVYNNAVDDKVLAWRYMPEPYTVNTPPVDDDFAEQYLMILGAIASLHPNLADNEIEALDWAIKKLEDKMPPKWIPSNVRLPEEDGRYWTTIIAKGCDDIPDSAELFKNSYKKGRGWKIGGVLAWMPIPKEYVPEQLYTGGGQVESGESR